MKKIFVGIDISKDKIDCSVLEKPDFNIQGRQEVENSAKAIDKYCRSLIKKFGNQDLWVCFEHTGNYGLLLAGFLELHSINYSAVPAMEIKQSLGITRGKNDKIDADRIAEYAATFCHKLKATSLPGKELISIKELLTYRFQLVKIRTQLKNSLKSHQLIQKHTLISPSLLTGNIDKRIKEINKDIAKLEAEVNKIISSAPEIKKNYDCMTSVTGIGLVIAAAMLVSTQNFTTFSNPRKYLCYIGTAPFEHSSGKYQGKTRTSKLRSKMLKTLLFNGAYSAVMHDQQIKQYLNRKLAEGKDKQLVMNAIACKLIYRVFAVVKRQSPFVPLAH